MDTKQNTAANHYARNQRTFWVCRGGISNLWKCIIDGATVLGAWTEILAAGRAAADASGERAVFERY